jgi:hypothetical protein
METNPTPEKAKEKRTYHNDAESARREVAHWAALFPWYGRLVEDVRDQLRDLDQCNAGSDAVY